MSLRGLRDRAPKVLAALLSTIALATASQAGQADKTARLPSFEVASVRPNNSPTDQFRLRFTADGVQIQNASLLMIVRAAYGMFNSLDDKFIGIPAWAKTEKFNIEAKVDPSEAAAFKDLSFEKRQLMVQALLADRFRLKSHPETRQQPVYMLSVLRSGSKLLPAKSTEGEKDISVKRSSGEITGTNAVIPQLISALTQALGKTVQDKTGLVGKYDFTLHWTPEPQGGDGGDAAPVGGAEGTIFTAIQEQLGLRLESGRAPVECLVVDHLERPSEN